MVKQSFEILLTKYLSGQCTADEKRCVDHWFELVGNDANQLQTEEEWQRMKNKIWMDIAAHTEVKHKRIRPVWYRPVIRYGVAACVILSLGIGIGWYVINNNENKFLKGYQTSEIRYDKNQSAVAIELKLDDGSLVKLDPGSVLSYPRHFKGGSREVILTGSAFFDIARNPDRPFSIQTEKTVTKVLGTSFFIKSDRKSNVEVEVKSGRVAFSESTDGITKNRGVELIPNQKGVYLPESNRFELGLSANPQVLREADFSFHKASVKDVLDVLQTAYGIQIDVDSVNVLRCNFTGELHDMTLYTQLDFICQSFNASYHVEGTRIRINGNGCK